MKEIIRAILTDLERTRENLLALSDEIWLDIDHNDNTALEAGTAFKKQYNEKMAGFDLLATDLSELVQQYTEVRLEEDGEPAMTADSTSARVIMALDKETPHSLDEVFTYKRPYGFVLRDRAVKDLVTWKQLYRLVCQTVLTIAEEPRRDRVNEAPAVLREMFTQDPDGLRMPLLVRNGLYVESNLSANAIRDGIRRLLRLAGIPESDLRIYLREDRDANRDTA